MVSHVILQNINIMKELERKNMAMSILIERGILKATDLLMSSLPKAFAASHCYVTCPQFKA